MSRLEDDETVGARVATLPERREAHPGLDRELSLELGYGRDNGSVVARVSDEQDRARGPEVALLRSEPPLGRLNIMEPHLGFDDRIELVGRGDPVGAAQVAGDGHGHLGLPRDGRSEAGRKTLEQRQMGLVPNSRGDRVDPQAQFMAKHGRQSREHVNVHVWGDASLDPDDLAMGDRGRTRNGPTAESGRHPSVVELISDAAKKMPAPIGASLRCCLSGWHGPRMAAAAWRGVTSDFTGAWNMTCYERCRKWRSILDRHTTCYRERLEGRFR